MPLGLELIEATGIHRIHPLYLQPFALLAGAFTALVLPWSRRRAKRGSCRFCGYPLAGLEDFALCPECGRPRAISHEWDMYGPVKYFLILIASFLPFLAILFLIAISGFVERSFNVNVMQAFDSPGGMWFVCTVGSFGLSLVHTLVLLGAAARWRIDMGWVVPLLILAVFANESILVFAALSASLVT